MDVPNSVPDQQNELDGSQGEIQAQLPDPRLDQEKYWLEASELITSKKDILRSTNHSNDYVEFVGSLNDVLGFTEDSLKAKTIEVTSSFRALLTSLADVLVIERLDFELGFKIVKILIKLSEKNIVSLESVSYVNVVCFLLRSCKNMTEKIMVPFSRYLKKLCSYLQRDHIKTTCLVEKNKFLPCLKTAFSNVQFCTSDAGIEAVGSFVALDSEFIKEFHARVLRLLMLCKKAHAISLGTIYFRIWENLSEDEQLVFEEDYIQWFMDRACTLGRTEMAQKHLLINVHALLSGLHQSRKGIKFSKVITKLYTPVLWKYLNSDNNIHRCNAAEVFMDVYPLEKPKEGAINYSKNLRKQHEEMLQLLDDACPVIRVIAIKGICLNMQYFWVTFQNGTAERVLKKFVSDLVLDGSSCDVRKAVYQGLTILLKCEQSHDVLKHVLPLLKDFIHDENKSVRQAFIFMLLKIRELDCKIKYHHIVNMENIAARLADDSPKNRLLIVRLILSSFFNEKLKLEDSFSRVCKFIKVNPIASRYLARYSYAELKFETAVRFMCLVFLKLRNAIKQTILPSENEDSEKKEFDNSHQYGTLKSGASLLGMIENIHINDQQNSRHTTMDTDLQASNISESGDTKHLLESRIMHGLLDFIGMLWLIHGKTLLKEENKERLEELYTHSERCLPIILRYSRGTHAYFGALNVASMIPFNKIYHVTTIAGACKTMLCELSPEAPANEYHSFIHALCRWNRGGDIIEIATDQIEDAFRSQSLNESASVSKTRSGKQVKFARTETNPMLALRILHELFSSPTDQSTIFSKNTDDMRALFKIISKIKILIKTRIENGSKISDILNDTFLVECLTLYGNLIIMFDQNKVENFDFWETFYEYLNWCNSLLSECDQCIGSTTEQIVDTFIFDLLKVPLMQSINVIALGKCDYQRCVTLVKFVHSLLHSSYSLYFVDLSLHFIKHLLLYCQARQDQLLNSEIMSVEFPVIMEKILDALTEEVLSKQTLLRFIKNFAEFKKNLIFVYCLSLKLYPEVNESNPSYKIMYPFCKSLINVMLFPITESETLNVDQDIKNLPFVGSLLAAVFTTQLDLASALFYVLRVIIEDFADTDGLKLLASTSLIYTFAFSKNKIPKSDLLKVVKIMYKKIQKLPTDDGCVAVVMNCDYSIHDRTIIDVEETTERAIKEVGLHILVKVAEKLGCSLSENTILGNCTSRKSVLEKSCTN